MGSAIALTHEPSGVPEDRQPELHDRYEVLRLLGQGRSGSVWQARDRHSDELVAVKIFSESRAELDFGAELAALAGVRDSAVVALRSVARTPSGSLCLVLEHCDGGSLRQFLRQRGPTRPVTEAETRAIAARILRGLVALHGAGFAHGDVKPENLLFGERDRSGWPCIETLKIADAGLATHARRRQARSDGRLTDAAGSRPYIAPEALSQSPDPQSDLYAVGLVIRELWGDGIPAECLHERVLEAPAIGENVPRAWRAFLDRLLSPRPEERYESARAALRGLHRCTRETEGLHPTVVHALPADAHWIAVGNRGRTARACGQRWRAHVDTEVPSDPSIEEILPADGRSRVVGYVGGSWWTRRGGVVEEVGSAGAPAVGRLPASASGIISVPSAGTLERTLVSGSATGIKAYRGRTLKWTRPRPAGGFSLKLAASNDAVVVAWSGRTSHVEILSPGGRLRREIQLPGTCSALVAAGSGHNLTLALCTHEAAQPRTHLLGPDGAALRCVLETEAPVLLCADAAGDIYALEADGQLNCLTGSRPNVRLRGPMGSPIAFSIDHTCCVVLCRTSTGSEMRVFDLPDQLEV